jgi:potassium-transporting ATPase KdpC subunit
MSRHIMISLRLILVGTVLIGLVYPLLITGLAQVFFPIQANGSMVRRNGEVIGSVLIGQAFTRPEYFHPRPSAAGRGYDATASSGSNLGPTSMALIDRVCADVIKLTRENPDLKRGSIPVDMVTASGSGLDPDISPANAYAQIPRVAIARRMSETRIRELVTSHIIPRQFRILGEPRINILKLNMALYDLGRSSRQ